MTDIYSAISNDHRLITILINQLVETHNTERREILFEQIADEIELHELAESQTFYSAFKEVDNALIAAIVERADNDHSEITSLIARMTPLATNSESWQVLLGQLKQAVEHHFRDEETILFALCRQLISPPQAMALANELTILKHRHRQLPPAPLLNGQEKSFLAGLFG